MVTEHLFRMQLAVETFADGACAVNVAGELTGATGPRLLRLLDQLLVRMAADGSQGRLMVDLANVRRFELDGLAALRHAHHRGAEGGVRLVLRGVDDHRSALPRRIDQALDQFDSEPVAPPGGPADRSTRRHRSAPLLSGRT